MKAKILVGLVCISAVVGTRYATITSGEAALVREQQRVARLQDEIATLTKKESLRDAQVRSAPKPATAPAAASMPATEREANRSLGEKPSAQISLADKLLRKVEQRYGIFFANQNLAPRQAERLTQLLVDRRHAEVAAVNTALASGKDMNGVEVKREAAAAQSMLEVGIGNEFGASVLGEYRRHEWSMSASDLVTTANATLQRTTPLTNAQASQLVGLLAQFHGANPGVIHGGVSDDPVPYRIRLDDNMMNIIAAVALPEQLRPFKAIKQAQEDGLKRRTSPRP